MQNYTEVFYKIENEGLGYFIQNYCNADSMPTKEGEILFEKARMALDEFEEFVNFQMREIENDDEYIYPNENK